MKLAVVVPTKNRPNELRNFLSSLWQQVFLPDQLIIVDQSVPSKTLNKKLRQKL